MCTASRERVLDSSSVLLHSRANAARWWQRFGDRGLLTLEVAGWGAGGEGQRHAQEEEQLHEKDDAENFSRRVVERR